MVHVKPHGMLYNQAAVEPALAEAIARAVQAVDPALRLVGLAGSELIRAGEKTRSDHPARGVRRSRLSGRRHAGATRFAGGADRGRRTGAGANPGDGAPPPVRSVDGVWAAVQAETVCLHGDGEHALAYARKLRDSFVQQGIRVSAEQ
ncbi:LamB/YcsF family protein [Serratia marcescens]|uniref:LamB/YcsF family protein n=1 Tax=Serratia marcescens TaxID=615 RepID=A0A380AL12_SERMA|nr:LamB/YcsF family protein [Serratia marcescens]